LTDVIKHSIPLVPDFKPKRLRAYRVSERQTDKHRKCWTTELFDLLVA